MKIIYIIITLALFITFLLLKKTEKKQNVLFWISATAVLFIPYNVITSYILTVIGLKCTLFSLAVVNALVLTILLISMLRKREIQKYYIKVKDIISVTLLLTLVVVIAYKQYGFPLQIKYETTDPGVHYNAAKTFYEQKVLLCKSEQTSYYNFKTFMPAAYVNTGILMQIFSGILDEVDMYMIYIIFDLIILFLIGVMFYLTITNETKEVIKSIIATILSIIFVLAYPLNSMLFGFAYLSVSLLLIITIIAMSRYLKNNEMKFSITLTTMFLLMYGIFFSYYLFVPVVYSAIGIYILIDIIKNRKEVPILAKNNIIKIIIILILPTILGFIYLVLPGIVSEGKTEISSMANEGYIYRDLYSNFIPFAPFMFYYIWYELKNNKNNVVVILTIILLLFIGATFLGGLLNKVSSYYYFKSYFVLWILQMYCTFRAFEIIMNNKEIKSIVYIFLTIYVGITVFLYLGVDQKITNKNVLFNPSQKSIAILDIQAINTTFINRDTTIIKRRQIDSIKYINNNIDKSEQNSIIIYGNSNQRLWVYELTGITDTKKQSQLYDCPISSIEEFIKSDKKYLLYMTNDKSDLEINSEASEYSIIFSNEYSAILEKK